MRKLKLASKICSVVFAILFAVMYTAYVITDENKKIINQTLGIKTYELIDIGDEDVDTDYYKSDYSSVADLRADGEKLIEEVEAGGAVLLKNENDCLPLKVDDGENKVSVFSLSSVDIAYVAKGSSSGTNPVAAVNLKDGFKDAGLSVNPTLYNYYQGNKSKSGYAPNANKINDIPWNTVSTASGVSASFSSYNDAAIFVIKRVRGENTDPVFNDTKSCDGEGGNYLALNDNEKSVLKGLGDLKGTTFKKIIVLFNTPNQVECAFLNNPEYKIDAALWIGTVGQTGLSAVGKILTGEVNPSGKLSDMFWNKHADNPAMANFGLYTYANSKSYPSVSSTSSASYTAMQYASYVVYQEGIYVGYRYTETRYEDVVMGTQGAGTFDYNSIVAYPFGYGLSYTTFEYSQFSVTYDSKTDVYTAHVTVKNTGNDAGREVIQIYLQKPYTEYDRQNGIEKAAVELVGYDKTELLQPNDSKKYTVEIAGSSLASYDSNGAKTYIVEGGEYRFTVGKDAHDAVNNILSDKGYTKADGMTQDGAASLVETIAKKSLDNKTYSVSLTGGAVTNLFDSGDMNKYENRGENSVTYVSRSNWTGTLPSDENDSVVLYLNDAMVADLLAQDNSDSILPDDVEYPVYGEYIGLSLVELMYDSEGNEISFDDPIWDTFMDQLTWEEIVELITNGLRSTAASLRIGKPPTKESNGPNGITDTYNSGENGLAYKYGDPDGAHSPPYYPSLGILASTFDRQLAARVGEMIGEDALWAGYSGLYGIGVNTHRSAYDGRASEYFSEDPYLAGAQATEVVKGLQAKGCSGYVKHVAGYEQQNNRVGLSVWCNEQAYREIYLEPFRMAIEEGGANNVMAAYSRVGVTFCPGSKALMTDFLRGECHMSGFAVSDMWKGRYSNNQFVKCIMAGLDLPDGNLEDEGAQIFDGFKTGYGGVANQMRLAAKRILYTTLHTNAMNGISPTTKLKVITPAWQIAVISATIATGVLFAIAAGGFITLTALDIKKYIKGLKKGKDPVETGET